MNDDQIAHDLAMVYVHNRHGAEVSGDFSVSTASDNEVTGSGTVATDRLPDVDELRMIEVGTGERQFFGLPEKKKLIEAGFKVDSIFEAMIEDYSSARSKFAELLADRQAAPDGNIDDAFPVPALGERYGARSACRPA